MSLKKMLKECSNERGRYKAESKEHEAKNERLGRIMERLDKIVNAVNGALECEE